MVFCNNMYHIHILFYHYKNVVLSCTVLFFSNLINCLILPERGNPVFKERRLVDRLFFHTGYLYTSKTVFLY